MFARKSALRLAGAAIAAVAWIQGPAHAQGGEPSGQRRGPSTSFSLTEEAAPGDKAWEDPARISVTLDGDGPDTFSAQVNLEVAREFPSGTGGRNRSVGGNLVWNRESGGEDRQNNFEIGAFHEIGYLTPLGSLGSGPPEAQDDFIDTAFRFSMAYARTAVYADATTPLCTATPNLAQCQTQRNESIRGSTAISLFSPALEENLFSIEPKIGADYDHLLNSPIDADTGTSLSGGYLSAVAGIAASLFPTAALEFSGSVQLRQRLYASDTRRPNIERSAWLFEASATYYFARALTEGVDAGVGVTYTRGDDPLTGVDNVNRFVISLRLGT
jgi:hypothetical protein